MRFVVGVGVDWLESNLEDTQARHHAILSPHNNLVYDGRCSTILPTTNHTPQSS